MSTSEYYRLLGSCSNDGDLAILPSDMARKLEGRLLLQPLTLENGRLLRRLLSSSDFHVDQRLVSAMQVSLCLRYFL